MDGSLSPGRQARCFLAYSISSGDLAPAVACLDRLRDALGDREVRWVDPSNLHMTVYFFGDLNRGRLIQARRVVEGLREEWDPVALRWGEPGCFPSSRRVQVIWLGVRDEEERLSDVARWVHDALRAADFPPPDKPFRAHLTLGRVRRGARVSWDAVRAALGGLTASSQPLTIRSLRLFQSVLRPQGPLYSELVHAPARGGEPYPEGE
jgi:2'-5' RNA ligase